jgi:MoaA/NifB/PqqE/SkfB family radical SAM enzyme
MLEAPAGIQPQLFLENKIRKTVDQIEKKFIKNVKGENSKKPYLRFSTVDLPFSMVMIDNEMIVTSYTTEAEADGSPTFIIEEKDSNAYKSFKEEFGRIWEKHSVVSPFKDVILKDGLQQWKEYLDLKKSYYNNEPVKTPPKQAIIYPTYECSNSCSHCMYKDKKGNTCISKDDFQNILTQLIDNKIANIELSGGGEPLESRNIDGILDVINDARSSHPEINFGLITNGIFLEKILGKYDLLNLFNDYIRISRLNEDDVDEKGLSFTEKYESWLKGVNLLLQKKKENFECKTKIGMKYLLTSKNKTSFVQMVRDDINTFLNDLDHVRFRSERTVDSDDIYPIEQDIYRLLRNSEKIKAGFEAKVALSLPNTFYPLNFKCWISPIHVVIDPLGDTYICCNYVVDPASARIGNILKPNFKDIWQSRKHIQCRHRLHRDICSCSEYCSNCRFAELQFNFEHIIATLGYDYTDNQIP